MILRINNKKIKNLFKNKSHKIKNYIQKFNLKFKNKNKIILNIICLKLKIK